MSSLILGESYNTHNNLVLPTKEVELYQSSFFSRMINTGLRRGFTSKTICSIIRALNHAIESHIPIGQEIILYRGVDKKYIPGTGDYTDKAFNSATSDPDVAKFYGDTVLRITFRPTDKLLFTKDKSRMEFIASPNITYRILGKSSCGRFIDVITIGTPKSIIFPVITSFDDIYTRVVEVIKEKVANGTYLYIFFRTGNIDRYFTSDLSNLFLPGQELIVGLNYRLYEDLYMKDVTKMLVCKDDEEIEEIQFHF